MNNKEAKSILVEYLSRYESCPYVELRGLLDETQSFEVTAPSGKEYQVAIQVFWDDKPNGDLRVVGSIDDGWLRAYSPLSDSFLVSPDSESSEQ